MKGLVLNTMVFSVAIAWVLSVCRRLLIQASFAADFTSFISDINTEQLPIPLIPGQLFFLRAETLLCSLLPRMGTRGFQTSRSI
ncbi:MAG: hypothetical protein PUP93_20980 [Rhizonema sp. NSF051]|nr:hypothetical protein [Rhizonema sp. NSF051]